MNVADPLLEALQHSLRREVLCYLQEHGTGSASEIARDLGVPVGNLSYHVRRLAQLRLIEEVRSVRRRGALMRVFRINDAYRHAVATLLSAEICDLAALAKADTRPVTVVQLDDEGLAALNAEMTRVSAELRELHDQALRRARDTGAAGQLFQVSLLVGVVERTEL